ncbi:MAG: hypothetical protein ACE3K2_25880 [Paenibacillus sp.]|uniref:hypothetical protein n=2 Tax=unclassified Paenibacillus TaxID=185978 RepID=UPI003B765C56
MKMKVKLKFPVILSLVVAMVGGTSSAAFAETENTVSAESNVARAFVVEDGVKKELNTEQYDLLIKENEEKQQLLEAQKSIMTNRINIGDLKSRTNDDDLITPFALIDRSRYVQAGFVPTVYRQNLARRISVPVYNSGTQTATRTITFAASQSYTSNVSLSASHTKKAFTAGVSVGASWSNSYSNTDSIAQPIPPKKYSWMQYTPNMSNSFGTMYEELWNFDGKTNVKITDETYFLDVYIAKKGNAGLPDGLYVIMETDTVPN